MRRKTGILLVGSLVCLTLAVGATHPSPVPLVMSDIANLAAIRIVLVVGSQLLSEVPALQAILIVAVVWAIAGILFKTVFLRK